MESHAQELFTLVLEGQRPFAERSGSITAQEVSSVLERLERLDQRFELGHWPARDFRRFAETLVAPAADPFRERIFALAAGLATAPDQKAPRRCVTLYAPIYLSNLCTNRCTYCGFRQDNRISRQTLTDAQIEAECVALASEGIAEVLLLTGEAPRQVGLDYLERAVQIARRHFGSVALEVFPMSTDGYRRMRQAGAEALTLYQETYDLAVYRRVHQAGRKRSYTHRLDAPNRAIDGGFQRIGIGALLGVGDWRFDAVALLLHAQFLQEKGRSVSLSFSFPRLRGATGAERPPSPVSDAELTQMMSILRLLTPRATLVLSTRESPELRDRLAGTLAQKLSAGSRTNPGGYSQDSATAQFEVHDRRRPEEVARALRSRGVEVPGFEVPRDLRALRGGSS